MSIQIILPVLFQLKNCFIYLNYTMAMLIFVPYMTLIALDLVVYIWRVFIDEWKVSINLLKSLIHKSSAEQVKKVQ